MFQFPSLPNAHFSHVQLHYLFIINCINARERRKEKKKLSTSQFSFVCSFIRSWRRTLLHRRCPVRCRHWDNPGMDENIRERSASIDLFTLFFFLHIMNIYLLTFCHNYFSSTLTHEIKISRMMKMTKISYRYNVKKKKKKKINDY